MKLPCIMVDHHALRGEFESALSQALQIRAITNALTPAEVEFLATIKKTVPELFREDKSVLIELGVPEDLIQKLTEK